MILMKSLDNRFASQKEDIHLNPSLYAELFLDNMEIKNYQWAESKKNVDFFPLTASAIACGLAVQSLAASSAPASTHSTPTSVINHETITCMHSDRVCFCHCKDHTIADCQQFILAGYLIEQDPEKAKEKWQAAQAASGSSPRKVWNLDEAGGRVCCFWVIIGW